MLKYFFGIILVQAVTITLVLLAPPGLEGVGWLRLIIPVLFTSFLAAFWFSSMAEHIRKDHLAKVQEKFAKERETIRVNAERSKARVMKQAHKDMAREAKVTHAKANFKVGAAFAGAIGVGALLLLTQFLTIGLLTLATAGGALGGYIYRGKRYKAALPPSDANNSKGKLIEVNPSVTKNTKSLSKSSG